MTEVFALPKPAPMPGLHVRVTCNYQNTRQEAVTFGESSFSEMCFLVMFLVGGPTGCVQGAERLTGAM